MNTPWILNEEESEVVSRSLLTTLKFFKEYANEPEHAKVVETLLSQYCGPRNLSIDYKEWKFVRFV